MKDHTDLIHKLDRAGSLNSEVVYIRMPFKSFDQDVFFERRDSGKRRLTNGAGNTFPADRVKIERTMLVSSDSNATGKKTIRVDTRSTHPNLIFFTDCGQQLDGHTQQLVGELTFRMWHKSQQRDITLRDLTELLRKLSAVVFHHINQASQPDLAKAVLFTDINEGRYFAPFAYIQGSPSKQALMDMKYVLDTDDLPDHVLPHDVESLVGIKRGIKPYTSKALQDIKRALSTSADQKSRLDLAASLMEQHLKTNPHQAIDLYDIVMNGKDDRDLIEDLANNALFQSASKDQALTMSTDDKNRILRKDFVEALINRC